MSDYKAFSGKFLGRIFLLGGSAVGMTRALLPTNHAAANAPIDADRALRQEFFAREAH